MSPQEEKVQNRIGDMTGLISKAKEGLAKSKSKGEISRYVYLCVYFHAETQCKQFDYVIRSSPSNEQEIKKPEPKKSENELHWEGIRNNMVRPLTLCDLDFTDLRPDDDMNDVVPGIGSGKIPPPPPMRGPPPPMMMRPVAPPTNLTTTACLNDIINGQQSGDVNGNGTQTIQKSKKTVCSHNAHTVFRVLFIMFISYYKFQVKLFWKEVREDLIPVSVGKTIWDELPDANIDTQKLEHLFESRAKDLMTKVIFSKYM